VAGKKFWEKFEDYMSAATFAEAGEAGAARSFIRPRRTILLVLTPGGDDARSAAYARSVASRVGAGVEILYLPAGEEQRKFIAAFKRELESAEIPCLTVTATGCLRQKILEHTARRSDIDFVVVESSEELDIQCERETKSLKDFISSLRIPLVVVSETQGMA
jgi:hypothetical protein